MSITPLVDFSEPTEQDRWLIVNDGVMGGRSDGRMQWSGDGTAIFSGSISLEQGGGFASVRARLGRMDLSSYHGLSVRFRGDGKRYRLRIRTDPDCDGIAYQASFDTTADRWDIIDLAFDRFIPSFRGRTPTGATPLDPSLIEQIGFMVADKQAGDFHLEIDWVRAYHHRVRKD